MDLGECFGRDAEDNGQAVNSKNNSLNEGRLWQRRRSRHAIPEGMMRWILTAAVMLQAHPAGAATSFCRPTCEGFLEFACAAREAPVDAASFCDVMNRQRGPVHWSQNDTEETKTPATRR